MTTAQREKDYLCTSANQEHFRDKSVGYGECRPNMPIYKVSMKKLDGHNYHQE